MNQRALDYVQELSDMTPMNQRIDEQASQWAIRLHPGPLAPEEQRELDRWLAVDPRHPGALLRAQATWLNLDRLGALATGRSMEWDDEMRSGVAIEVGCDGPIAAAAKPDNEGGAPPDRPLRLALAASIAALAIVAGATVYYLQTQSAEVYISDIGEIRRITLEDGSNMILSTATQATVRMDEVRRDIQLDKGEGLFEVAKDATRPFVVRAGFVSVRAIGTVFSVRSVDKRIDVTVTEGIVELIDTNHPDRLIQRIAANERATLTDVQKVNIQPLAREQAKRRLAWTDGMVAFDGESLYEAVAEMNRHNRRHIIIDDPALAARPVVGIFRASDPENFAETVSIALGARSANEDDAIHLR